MASRRNSSTLRHLFIPDPQVKPGESIDHLKWAARYAADKRPAVIVEAGDWHDMPSLSSYDKGTRSAEGRRYRDDIEAGNVARDAFDRELSRYSPRSYRPRKVAIGGNHDFERINRAIELDPKMHGQISTDDLGWKQAGWHEVPFLKPITIHGITYMHYCPLGANGRVVNSRFGAPSAREQAKRMMRTTVCGHKQGKDLGEVYTPGRTIRGVIAGSFYPHEERYLTQCGETYWRGILLFAEVSVRGPGEFDLVEASIDFLGRRYG